MTSVTLSTPNIDGTYYPFQNLKVFVNGTQFGTQTNGYVTGNNSYTFSGNPVMIPSGGTATVSVYEDIQSGAVAGDQRHFWRMAKRWHAVSCCELG